MTQTSTGSGTPGEDTAENPVIPENAPGEDPVPVKEKPAPGMPSGEDPAPGMPSGEEPAPGMPAGENTSPKAGGISPVVLAETGRVAVYTAVGTGLMWLVFGVLHLLMPDKVPFDWTVVLGGAGGGTVAVLNFFLMGIGVQKAASASSEDQARAYMKTSYIWRMLMQGLWMVAAIAAPCFHFVAGLVPLLMPGAGIKITGIFGKRR